MKKTIFILLFVLLIFTACSTKNEPVADIPNDFTFSLTWGCNGESFYDSNTGKLIKTTNATNPDEYITTLLLNEIQKESVRNILSNLDFTKYPAQYNPNDKIESLPSMTLILTLQYGDTKKSITCKNIAISYESSIKDGQLFLTACSSLIDVITNTDEWKSLPEYEFFYE